MSWQAATLAGLALVLALGFGWYERSRPDARVIALVAALAALAVAGRLALTPLPNVVATTDIALFTGYALGGAPGFAVGALAAPISNLWLGQGPWTAWEMAGWGLAGLCGASLAALFGHRLGRWRLAIACATMGLLYGALLDLSVMVGYGGEQSLDRYLALSARGLPFNLAHASGNFVIAFVAGPALVRMIARYRERLDFRWHPAGALPLLLVAVIAGSALAGGLDAHAAAKRAPRVWLEQARSAGGGYAAGPGLAANPQMTGWAMLGLEAAGRNPRDVGPRGRTPANYLRDHARSIRSVADLERTILALEGAGINSTHFAGRNLVVELRRGQSGNGSFQKQVNLTAYGILALRAAGHRAGIGPGASWLASAQNGDGGWGFGAGQPSDPDSTGAALQGVALAGLDGSLQHGVGYLRRSQRREGGWGLNGTGVTNSQSTAWAIQGLVAAGVPPRSVTRGGHSGLAYLRARRRADGVYKYSASSDQTPVWVTSQALLAVSREALPVEPVPRATQTSTPRPRPDIEAGTPGVGDRNPATSPPSPINGSALGRARRSAIAGTAFTRDPSAERGGVARAESPGSQPGGAASGPGRDPVAAARSAGGTAPPLALARSEERPATAGSSPSPGVLFAALGILAAALAGGFAWYRRTLP